MKSHIIPNFTDYLEHLSEDDPASVHSFLKKELKMEATRPEHATDAANIGLWSLDLETNIFWANQKTRDIFSFSPDYVISFQAFIDKVYPDDHGTVKEGILCALRYGESLSIEYRITNPDGSTRWINARGSLYSTTDKPSSILMGVVIDITARKMCE